MASVRAIRVDPKDPVGHRLVSFQLITAISQTGVVAFSYTPKFAFQIVRVYTYCLVKAGTVTCAISVGARTAVTSIAFTTATEVEGTLSTTRANIVGSSSEALTFAYTSDSSGVLTNGSIVAVIRPFPMHGETQVGP